MRRFQLVLYAVVAVLTLSGALPAQLFGPPESVVEAKLEIDRSQLRPGDSFAATVTATIKDSYHVGAHHKDAPSEARLEIEAEGVTFDEPAYPPAELLPLAFSPGKKVPVYEGTITFTAAGKVNADAASGATTVTARLTTQACTDDQCFPPDAVDMSSEIQITGGGAVATTGAATSAAAGTPAADGRFAALAGKHVLLQIVLLYGLGLLLAFTPCIYPMVPVTIGYFTGQATSGTKSRGVVRLAVAYVLGLAITYAVLGAFAARTGGVFGAALQKPPVIIALAGVLVALALSMFGLYELRAPGFVERRSAGRAGVAGALIMGAIFGIVAAPCAGPVVIGLMVHVAALGSAVLGFAMFFAFALGLGTPLFALGVFSAKLPVPGMWMVGVKKLAGFLLLGAAAYFLLPLVPEPYSTYLIPLVILSAAVYFAFFEESVRSSPRVSSVSRAVCVVLAVVAVAMVWPTGGTELVFEDYSLERLSEAARDGTPVMIDFMADWCGVCREMEHGPFRDAKVVQAADRFVRLQVNATHGDEVADVLRDFNVRGFPTLIFFDSTGKQAAAIVGFADSSTLIEQMKAIE